MKNINLLITLFLLLTSCNDEGLNTFKGKLVKKGICMNYVIEVNDSDFPQEILEKKWTDDSSQKNMKKFLDYIVYAIFLIILKKMIRLNL